MIHVEEVPGGGPALLFTRMSASGQAVIRPLPLHCVVQIRRDRRDRTPLSSAIEAAIASA